MLKSEVQVLAFPHVSQTDWQNMERLQASVPFSVKWDDNGAHLLVSSDTSIALTLIQTLANLGNPPYNLSASPFHR